jgi:hypothetical protein
MVRIPSNALPLRIEVLNDAIAGGTDYDIGLYQTLGKGAAVADADLFASGIDMTAARTLPLDALFESAVVGIEEIEERLWQLLDQSADTSRDYDVCFTANTVGTAAGTLSLRMYWTI